MWRNHTFCTNKSYITCYVYFSASWFFFLTILASFELSHTQSFSFLFLNSYFIDHRESFFCSQMFYIYKVENAKVKWSFWSRVFEAVIDTHTHTHTHRPLLVCSNPQICIFILIFIWPIAIDASSTVQGSIFDEEGVRITRLIETLMLYLGQGFRRKMRLLHFSSYLARMT